MDGDYYYDVRMVPFEIYIAVYLQMENFVSDSVGNISHNLVVSIHRLSQHLFKLVNHG